MSEKLKYRQYKVGLEIGIGNTGQEDVINPSEEFSQEQWDALTREEQEQWLYASTKEWANNYINYWWE